MLKQRLAEFVEPRLRDGETIAVVMAGFRPLTRSAAFMATFALAIGGLAASTALGVAPWLGGGVGGVLGAALGVWLDHRRARAEHAGKGLAIGLVVTDLRVFVLDLATGIVTASVAGIHLERLIADLQAVEVEKMQGSGLKRPGVVLGFGDGTVERVIPARMEAFLEAVRPG